MSLPNFYTVNQKTNKKTPHENTYPYQLSVSKKIKKQSIVKWVRNIFLSIASHTNFIVFLLSMNDSKNCSSKRAILGQDLLQWPSVISATGYTQHSHSHEVETHFSPFLPFLFIYFSSLKKDKTAESALMENFTTSLEYKKAVVNPTETVWLFRSNIVESRTKSLKLKQLAFPEEVNQGARKFSSN